MMEDPTLGRTNRGGTSHEVPSPLSCGGHVMSFWILLLAATLMLSGCGGTSSAGSSQQRGSLSGNWQFSMPNTDPNYPKITLQGNPALYGLQGGFLLQNNGSLTGQTVYSISTKDQQGNAVVCNSGTATITGTISGQTVTLIAVVGTQTFMLTGTLSSDGSKIGSGTFSTKGDSTCGAAETGLPWSATLVPPLTGSITGGFHSGQYFPVTGSLTQSENIGASNATVTGTLSFIDPTTLLSDYPCFPSGLVSVNGQISGNTVILNLIGNDGSNNGQIGVAPTEAGANFNGAILQPVTFDSTSLNGNNSYILHSTTGNGYAVNTKACAGKTDSGNLCLALNSTTACQQPITLTPAALTFAPQLLTVCGAAPNCAQISPVTQTITLTNNTGQELDGLSLGGFPQNLAGQPPGSGSDFDGIDNFWETDTCGPNGTPAGMNSFSLGGPNAPMFCTITIAFTPQQSCTWQPVPAFEGIAPAFCPQFLNASFGVISPVSADAIKTFVVPIIGTGLSFLQPSVSELDFGAEALGEASLPQILSFTNYSANSVQILPPSTNCPNTLPRPLNLGSGVSGLQVVIGTPIGKNPLSPPNSIYCDIDPKTHQANFQISADTCSGTNLAPQATCGLEITFVPQSSGTSALDYFLELNTVQCTTDQTSDCEIDSGRFPVELRANIPSPLRLSPAAGLNFGNLAVGTSSVTQTVTLLNDPNISNPLPVTIIGKVAVSGNYTETDDCPFILNPGSSCNLAVTFKPKTAGYNPGTLSINYSVASNGQPPQTVYLHGTGQ